MTLIININDGFVRFVSCVAGTGLLMILLQAARCVSDSQTHPTFPDGSKFTDGFKKPPTRRNNLIRGGIFRGKILRRTNQNNVNRLEERTLPAPN
jgi:hypothetical protein